MFGFGRTSRVVGQPVVLRWLPLLIDEYRDVRGFIEEKLPSAEAVRDRIRALLRRGVADKAEVIMPSGRVVEVIDDSMPKRGINEIV